MKNTMNLELNKLINEKALLSSLKEKDYGKLKRIKEIDNELTKYVAICGKDIKLRDRSYASCLRPNGHQGDCVNSPYTKQEWLIIHKHAYGSTKS